MSKKQEGKAEKLFKKLGKKIDGMISDLSDLKTDTGNEFHKRVDEMKKNKETLENELKDFGSKNKHKWEEIEQSLENAAQELRKAFSVAFSSHKKNKSSEEGMNQPESGGDPSNGTKKGSGKKKPKKKASASKAKGKKASKVKSESSKKKTKKPKK